MKKADETRNLSNYREIFESIEKDLCLDLKRADGDYLSSVPADGSATRNHTADSITPNYAAKGLAALIRDNQRRVAAAKKRLRNGAFGICVDPECGAAIEDARLFKNPFIERCLPCQKEEDTRIEREKRMACCRPTIGGRR